MTEKQYNFAKGLFIASIIYGLLAIMSVILVIILLLWGKSTQNHALALQGLAMIIIFGWVVYLAI